MEFVEKLLDAVEVLKKEKLNLEIPKIKKYNTPNPNLLMNEQSEFSKTGGIHASSLIDTAGKSIGY